MILSEEEFGALPRPPLQMKSVVVKFIRPDDLPIDRRDRFFDWFRTFFDDPPPDPRRENFEKDGVQVEESFNMRRFSGGRMLPRGRYYVVCQDERGFSHQTLAMELLAYATIHPDFETDAFDLSDPSAATLIDSFDGPTKELCAQYGGKVVVARRRPLKFNSEDVILRKLNPTTFNEYLVIPYELKTIESGRLLDLRERKAMSWLLRLLWEHFPGAGFIDGEPGTYSEIKRATAGRGPTVISVDAGDKLDQLPVIAGLRNVGLKDVPGNEWPFLALLQYILNPSHGGTPIDDLIGSALQNLGVECLIYPSARHDCLATYEGRRLKSWIGFDLVDYRGWPAQYTPRHFHIVENLTFWQALHGALDMPAASNSYEIGSWGVHGLATQTRRKIRELSWRTHFVSKEPIVLASPILVERTPWLGYAVGFRRRKPGEFESWLELRRALAGNEIVLEGAVLRSDVEGQATTIGEYIAKLSERHDLWGVGPCYTVHPRKAWCLVQKSEKHGTRLICPICGDVQEEKKYYPSSLLFCHSCFAGRKTQDCGEEEDLFDAIEQATDDVVAR